MLTTRLRKQIEWHFYNFKTDENLYSDKVQDILDSGLTATFDHAGNRSQPGNPTEKKAIRLEALDREKDWTHNWSAVVRNTFNAFRFDPEYEIMVELYIKGKRMRDLVVIKKKQHKGITNGIWKSTLLRWRDKWLEYAYKWAQEFRLL